MMLHAYRYAAPGLAPLPHDADLAGALWIDLYRPLDAQVAAVTALGIEVPSLSDMEEIEISNRLYRDAQADYMTVVLPGLSTTKTPTAGPVTFILTQNRLVTVRHHAPRPFETFPDRAEKATAGCASAERIFLGLVEECVARLADLLEAVGRELDGVSAAVFSGTAAQRPDVLQSALERTGQQGDLLNRIRLGLLSLERAMSYYSQTVIERPESKVLRAVVKGQTRDLQALEVHADFLSSRVSLAVDATLGMVNLAQNATVRIVSVVAVLFLPPTLIASIYGMNFAHMPELAKWWGYPLALALMLASAVGTYVFFKWRRWL
jgi:magnesium transporter